LKTDNSWRKWQEDTSWSTAAWDPKAANRGRHNRMPGSSKASSKSPEGNRGAQQGQHNRSNRGKKPIKRRQQWIVKTSESQMPEKETATFVAPSREELAEKRKSKSALWEAAVKSEPQVFNLTTDDSDDDEADFFPGEAREHDDPCEDDSAWLRAAEKPRADDLDNDPHPQHVAPADDVPLAADLNVSPSPQCMKQAFEGPLSAHLDLGSLPVVTA
jgi:hypothetical protein